VTSGELGARLRAMFVEELEDQLRAANEHLLKLEQTPDDGEELRSLFRVMHTLKGAARSAGFAALERTCHRLEALLAAARDEARALRRSDIDMLFAGVDELASALAELRGEATPVREPTERRAEPATPRESAVRVGQDRVDSLFSISNRLLILSARVDSHPAEVEHIHDAAVRAAAAWRRVRRLVETSPEAASVARELAAIDESTNILRKQSAALLGDAMHSARDLSRLAGEVSRGVRELRMRPFADALADLPRLARDVAAATGKQVQLVTSGEAVQADRAVLGQIHDALMHLVRNAVDHGIETPAVRRALGKAEQGTVSVKAVLIGDRIVVSVRDDGAGVDSAAIRRRLAERGEGVPDDDRAVARRLFFGGLSTRAAATTISGRGVGLDAVRAAADRVRGSVDVDWVPGRGTTFTIEAPLTLATVRVVLARVSNIVVAIPAAFVERLVRVPVESLLVVNGHVAVETPESPALVASLATVLGPPIVDRPAEQTNQLAIVQAGDRRVALRVDELLEEAEVVVRPIRAHGPRSVPHVSGAAILAGGTVALVLNVTGVVVTALGAAAPATSVPKRSVGPKRRRILVVDDSITTRTLEASVLEAAGYETLTAVDGADGWRVLQERGADLVVTDVEMPRMDGLELCEAIRGSHRFRELPVVLVTALETPEHRARGLEVGADAYLGKSSFEQESLLTTVRDLLGGAVE
jgi:two-component system chemotaxis sensor kinase CheA